MPTIRLAFLLLLLPLLPMAQSAPGVCAAAVHDAYRAKGPDGQWYATWHPQIDPSGCVFDHEHGSDPARFYPGAHPLYGYTAAAMGMTEPHAGFKSYVFDANGYRWLITAHTGSSGIARACARYHTVDVAARRLSDMALVADLHLVPDFGQGRINTTGARIPCADMAEGSTGVRLIPSAADGNVGYEAWRVAKAGWPPFIAWNDATFWLGNPQTACNDATCTTAVRRTDGAGTFRRLTLYGLRVYGSQGVFTYAGAAQYIAPGTDASTGAPGDCAPWGDYAYWCEPAPQNTNEAPYRGMQIAGPN